MRVLFTTWGWGSHFNPMVPLGWALRAAGHEVVVASHPCMAPTITGAGLTALAAGPDVDMAADVLEMGSHIDQRKPVLRVAPEDMTPEHMSRMKQELKALRIFVRSSGQIAGETLEFARDWKPDLVVHEPLAFSGPLIAAKLGVPAVRHLYTVDSTATITMLEPRLLAGLREEFECEWIHTVGDLTLDPCPPRLRNVDELPRQPIRYIPYNGPTVYPAWLTEPPRRRPRVCVSWGTSLQALGFGVVVPNIVRALGSMDIEVVVAVVEQQRHLFEPAPDNVVHIGPVPLNLLLPSCDAIVHQGGGGTMMTALDAGIPQVVVPWIFDQMYNADRLAETGAGSYAWAGDVTDEQLRAQLTAALADPAQRAARELAEQVHAMPAPAQVVPVLEDLAAIGEWRRYPSVAFNARARSS